MIMTSADGPGLWPVLPYDSWRDTLATIHRFAQVVGKIRLAAAPRRNHWWNVPFHVTGRGITTRPMRDPTGRGTMFASDFDFLDHRLDLSTVDGRRWAFPLAGQSVAGFTTELFRGLDACGITVRPERPHPFDLPDARRPFVEDHEHADYDPAAVTRYWQTLSRVNLLLEEFAGDWAGKTSPVHHFWHTFDIAVTRFSDRHVDPGRTTDPVTREAYSREVISSGFWFGDEEFPEPAFYSYTAPEPAGLSGDPLRPDGARWVERRGSHLAVLTSNDVRRLPDPHAAVLEFYASAFRAGAARAGWDLGRDTSVHGITDPYGG
jgi:Family of unknown function (DUF5996)